jgi:arsenite oxidase small subunit
MYVAGAAGTGVALFLVLPKVFDSGSGGDAGGDGAVMVGVFPSVKVASLSALEDGVPVFFDYPLEGQANILVKMGEPVVGGVGPEEDIVAFSKICTHMGCPISEYQHEYKALGPCPCHYSTFDLIHGGMVAMGQATQNLPQVLLNVEGDSVIAGGLVRLVYGYTNSLEGGELVGGTL